MRIDHNQQVQTVTLTQAAASTGPTAGRREIADVLGLDVEQVRGAPVVCSTGAAHLLVLLRDRDALGVIQVRGDLAAALASVGAQGCYTYVLEDPETGDGRHASARFFNPGVGITEDPATGSAAGPLAARMAADGHLDGTARAVIVQGEAIGRPSRLHLTVHDGGVDLTGCCVITATGTVRYR